MLVNIISMLGGLGLFLYGMKMMSDGLEEAAGSKLRQLLEVLTKNRFVGVFVGMIFTMIIQSSSATTVMVVGFVNAGLMNLAQATSVILGANIGTTITAQIIAFKLDHVAPLLVIIGVVLILFTKRKMAQRVGYIIGGFGMLFVGITLMGAAMKPLANTEGFQSILLTFKNPFLAILAATVFTMIIQSSSASIGVLQVLAMQTNDAGAPILPLTTAFFLLLGMNIGTCITAMLASIGASRTAKRAALIHLFFNVLTSIVVVVVVTLLGKGNIYAGADMAEGWITSLSRWINPDASTSRIIANTHTIFNILGVLFFLPLINVLIKISGLIAGEQPEKLESKKLMYLDARILETPAIAVAQVSKEVNRMIELAQNNLAFAMEAITTGNLGNSAEFAERESVMDYLNTEITGYLVKINPLVVSRKDEQFIGSLFHVVNDAERIGDHSVNIYEFAQTLHEERWKFSPSAQQELQDYYIKVKNLLDRSVDTFKNHKYEDLDEVAELEQEVDDIQKALQQQHIDRLNQNICTPHTGTFFLDIINNLERVGDHSHNIAFSIKDKNQ